MSFITTPYIIGTQSTPVIQAKIIEYEAEIRRLEADNAALRLARSVLEYNANAKKKIRAMELKSAILVKEKIFLIQLIGILFQIVCLSSPTNFLKEFTIMYNNVFKLFEELNNMVAKFDILGYEMSYSLKKLENKFKKKSLNLKKIEDYFITLMSEEKLLEQLTPLFKITKKARNEDLTSEEIKTFGSVLESWMNLPVNQKWSLIRSLNLIQMGVDLFKNLCERTAYQPLFDVNFDDFNSDFNLEILKKTFINNFSQILDSFVPKNPNQNNYIHLSNSFEPIPNLFEIINIESKIAASIMPPSTVPPQFIVDFNEYISPSCLQSLDVFKKKIELCNLYITSTMPNTSRFVFKDTVKTNIFSLMMFKHSVYENIVSEKSQKAFLLSVIEWLIGLLTVRTDKSLYNQIYNSFNTVEQADRFFKINSYLEDVIIKYDILNKVMINKCDQMGINVNLLLNQNPMNKISADVVSDLFINKI